MIRVYAIFSDDGRIQRVVSCRAAEASRQADSGEGVVLCDQSVCDSTHYVFDGQVAEKQPLNLPSSIQITANGTDEAVISGIPAGATVEWPDGQIDEVTDGEVRISVDLPGTYTLIFDAVPYLRQEVTIEAVAAT